MTEYQHVYRRDDQGLISHRRIPAAEAVAGADSALGDPEPLRGWPTPAMRPVLGCCGSPTADYVGVDPRGRIVWDRKIWAAAETDEWFAAEPDDEDYGPIMVCGLAEPTDDALNPGGVAQTLGDLRTRVEELGGWIDDD
ncbi:MAG: hypothetical protein ACOC8E_08500 [Planctomycetota bacterium]